MNINDEQKRRMINTGAKFLMREVNKKSDEDIYREMKKLQRYLEETPKRRS